MTETSPRTLAILGSTGSIGTQTLDIVAANPGKFRIDVLTAHSNVELLASQARKFGASLAVIARPELEGRLRELLEGTATEVASGPKAIEECVSRPGIDMVVTAMVGYSGLPPTLAAISAGKTIALANKETLVAGGELITRMLRGSESRLLPVDSEHSAIFQCLQGECRAEVAGLILTASGGPFRTLPAEALEKVTVKDALNHPNWSMGAKVTIDSASMMNKGLEMIEARWLFDVPPEQIEIAVHPQSVVHSMVRFCDGSVKAQLGLPDMHLPIAYALGYPRRIDGAESQIPLHKMSTLTFEEPDMLKFPLLRVAFDAIAEGGTAPCVMNAANEVAVSAFLQGEIRFTYIPGVVQETLQTIPTTPVEDFQSIMEADKRARACAETLLRKLQTN